MEVVDDMKLGLLLSRAGFRTRAFVSQESIRVEWGGTVAGIVRLLEKNMFAHMRFSVAFAASAALLFAALWVAAGTGPWQGGAAGWAACLGPWSLCAPALAQAWRHRAPILPALLCPLGTLVMIAALANSTLVTLRQGGVRWRDTFHTLAELRRGRVR